MKLPLLCISFICVLFYTPVSFSNSDNTVSSPSGEIIGKTIIFNGTPVKVFLGIPYAKPPVGDLRFKKPVPIEPWNKPLEATSLPPGCPQYSSSPGPTVDRFPGLSENCLYLNIWVPFSECDCSRKSVMFFIHTGGFDHSSTRLDFIQGQALAAEGDVIVVTTNYRLGALGFFYSGTPDAPGNVGILDMIESLKWVRNNIESFGGDKESITIFGHSSGGIAVGIFTVSPLTRKGLFRRAIVQSGSPTYLDAEDNNRTSKTSQKLAEAFGCANDEISLETCPECVVQCMRGVDAQDLAVKLGEVTKDDGHGRTFNPRFGDELLPRNPRVMVIEGDFEPVDLLIGSSNGDGSPLLTKSYTNITGYFGEKDPQINITFGETIIRELFKNFSNPDTVVNQYLGSVDPKDYYEIRFQDFTSIGDYERNCPTVYFAESFAEKNRVNVFYYFFTRRPSFTPYAPWMLAEHDDDEFFVFGDPLRYPLLYSKEDQDLSRRVIKAWSSFTKTGRPEPFWPQYSKEFPMYQQLDTDAESIGFGPHRENCNFFRRKFGF